MHAPGLQCGQAQSRESTEVAVEAAQLGTVLDGKRGEVGVGDEIAARACADQQARQHGGVAFSGVKEAGARVVEPVVDLPQGLIDGERARKDAGACGDAQETQQHDPGIANAVGRVMRVFQPARCGGLLRRIGVDRVQQHVEVGHLHGR